MILDSSAILAILAREADADGFSQSIEEAKSLRLSAANWLEVAIRVDSGGGEIARDALDEFVREAGVVVEPVTEHQAKLARQAYRAYGKGRHPAGLNFGDCFAYALAKATGEPLLFKGNDFAKTDLKPAL
ncbi:MAG: type II toxin-antitoxin system VapC family toxin [Alphaproteobacteria bacterium]